MRSIITGCFWIALLAAVGCDTAELADCGDICDTYDDCFENLDEAFCRDRCADYADQGEAYEDQVDLCNDCFDQRGCSADCNAQCDGIVPPI